MDLYIQLIDPVTRGCGEKSPGMGVPIEWKDGTGGASY